MFNLECLTDIETSTKMSNKAREQKKEPEVKHQVEYRELFVHKVNFRKTNTLHQLGKL